MYLSTELVSGLISMAKRVTGEGGLDKVVLKNEQVIGVQCAVLKIFGGSWMCGYSLVDAEIEIYAAYWASRRKVEGGF